MRSLVSNKSQASSSALLRPDITEAGETKSLRKPAATAAIFWVCFAGHGKQKPHAPFSTEYVPSSLVSGLSSRKKAVLYPQWSSLSGSALVAAWARENSGCRGSRSKTLLQQSAERSLTNPGTAPLIW